MSKPYTDSLATVVLEPARTVAPQYKIVAKVS